MSWEWVVLILGLVLNLTIIIVAMSDGAQYRLGGKDENDSRQQRTGTDWGTDPKIQKAFPKHETP
jgi:hypothetical protein